MTSPYIPKTLGLQTDAEDPVIQVLATSAYSLQRTICIMDNNGLILSEPDANEASSMLLLHCKTYCWLAARFFRDRVMLFRVRRKLHYMVHQAWQVKEQKLNLSGFTTFEEESFLGKIKGIICSCHGPTCYVRFFQRYLLCLALMVRRQFLIPVVRGFAVYRGFCFVCPPRTHSKGLLQQVCSSMERHATCKGTISHRHQPTKVCSIKLAFAVMCLSPVLRISEVSQLHFL